jgi:hypothetical protein
MNRRRLAFVGALLGAAVAGAVVTVAVWDGNQAPATTTPPPVSTATVVRTDLASTVLTEGTLGYAPAGPVVNRVAGTYTALPAPGTVVQPGSPLYRVDNLPVVLAVGTTPAWRPFTDGMTDGPDVAELEANLIALGDASGLFSTATDHFGFLTADAVERWQTANGYPVTGQIDLGQLVFLSGPVLVGAAAVAPGDMAAPGQMPYQVTTTTRVVTVPVNPNLPTVTVGEAVAIVLPTSATTPGTVTAIGPAPPGTAGSSSSSSSSGGGGSNGSDQSQATTVLWVSPNQPGATGTTDGVPVQVSLTTQLAQHVLAVPISALLALAGGGYGVELIEPSGAHRLVGVTTGVFSSSEVQVTSTDLDVGTKVVVAQ